MTTKNCSIKKLVWDLKNSKNYYTPIKWVYLNSKYKKICSDCKRVFCQSLYKCSHCQRKVCSFCFLVCGNPKCEAGWNGKSSTRAYCCRSCLYKCKECYGYYCCDCFGTYDEDKNNKVCFNCILELENKKEDSK